MANFKPQVTYMTSESLHDYRVERYRVTSPYKTERFKTYAELKTAHAISPIQNPLQIRTMRRTVARLATELSKREL